MERAPASFRVAVLASGTGTNLQAILDQVHGREGVEVVAVGSDRSGAPALERAAAAGIEVAEFPAERFADRGRRDLAIADWLADRGVDLVVLAGYMQLLDPRFVRRFQGRIVNVHPALLPAFPVSTRSARRSLTASGSPASRSTSSTRASTRGRSSSSVRCRYRTDRDRGALEATIHATEHALLPEAIRMIAAGRVEVDPRGGRVVAIEAGAGGRDRA